MTPSWSGLKKRSIVNWASSPCDAHTILPITATGHFHVGDLAGLIEPNNPRLSVTRQTELLGLSRRTAYYQPVDNTDAQALLKRDMDAVDAIYTDYPFYGSRRMRLELLDRLGIDLGRKRIRKVMKLLGLEAQYPKPNTSKPGIGTGHAIYPYLLRGMRANYPNHIWGTDTFVRPRASYTWLLSLTGSAGMY